MSNIVDHFVPLLKPRVFHVEETRTSGDLSEVAVAFELERSRDVDKHDRQHLEGKFAPALADLSLSGVTRTLVFGQRVRGDFRLAHQEQVLDRGQTGLEGCYTLVMAG